MSGGDVDGKRKRARCMYNAASVIVDSFDVLPQVVLFRYHSNSHLATLCHQCIVTGSESYDWKPGENHQGGMDDPASASLLLPFAYLVRALDNRSSVSLRGRSCASVVDNGRGHSKNNLGISREGIADTGSNYEHGAAAILILASSTLLQPRACMWSDSCSFSSIHDDALRSRSESQRTPLVRPGPSEPSPTSLVSVTIALMLPTALGAPRSLIRPRGYSTWLWRSPSTTASSPGSLIPSACPGRTLDTGNHSSVPLHGHSCTWRMVEDVPGTVHSFPQHVHPASLHLLG
ncbi:hypothetical protein OG21DRAFT_1523110 [Imleria badia]|nr:hypothetical protein OG21DRAFT_1523110 [Imleria badia]